MDCPNCSGLTPLDDGVDPYANVRDAIAVVEWSDLLSNKDRIAFSRMVADAAGTDLITVVIHGAKGAAEAFTMMPVVAGEPNFNRALPQLDHPEFRAYLAARLGVAG